MEFIIHGKGTRHDLLIEGKQYKVYREGRYLGIATYTIDDINGEVFLHSYAKDGQQYKDVFTVDEWELLP